MKKNLTTMMLLAMATASFAQNPAGVKQVMSAEKYSDAKEILKSAEGTMTNQERAKAYNKLVDLAVDENTKAEEKATKAQLEKNDEEYKKQSEKKGKSAYNALKAAIECNKSDQQPNEKGKVNAKFQEKNVSRLLTVRNNLIDPALTAFNNHDYATAKKYFGMFVDSRQDSLFSKTDFSAEKNIGQIAYYAGLAAFFDKDTKKANKYADVALNSGEEKAMQDAVKLKTSALDAMLKDSTITADKYEKQLQKLSEKMPDNEAIFTKLYTAYTDNGKKDKADKLINSRLAANPTDAMANALKGQTAQNNNDFATAIDCYSKVLQAKPDFLAAKMNLGVCYLNRAQNTINENQNDRGQIAADKKESVKADLNQAKTILEDVKAADPNCEQANWKYPMERVEYALQNLK